MEQLVCDKLADAITECNRFYESLSFAEKHAISAHNIELMSRVNASSIRTDGYAGSTSSCAVRGSGGNHYVYVWAHLFTGQIFYVGSGSGDRWVSKNRGNAEMFYKNLDAGDCGVFKVLEDVDKKTARFYERYISLSLSKNGVELVNGDNIYGKSAGCRADSWMEDNRDRIASQMTKDVEQAIIEKVPSDLLGWRNVMAVMRFREEYGDNYFSSNWPA